MHLEPIPLVLLYNWLDFHYRTRLYRDGVEVDSRFLMKRAMISIIKTRERWKKNELFIQ